MSRVLVTGGAGTIGTAVVRRLLRDHPSGFDVRVSDQRTPPDWMRDACEIHTGDLRDYAQAREAADGCSHVIHLAAIVGGIANFHKLPHTLLEVNTGLYNALQIQTKRRFSNGGSVGANYTWSRSGLLQPHQHAFVQQPERERLVGDADLAQRLRHHLGNVQ